MCKYLDQTPHQSKEIGAGKRGAAHAGSSPRESRSTEGNCLLVAVPRASLPREEGVGRRCFKRNEDLSSW